MSEVKDEPRWAAWLREQARGDQVFVIELDVLAAGDSRQPDAHGAGLGAAAEALSGRPGVALWRGELGPLAMELSLLATSVVASPCARLRAEGGRAPLLPTTLPRLVARAGAGGALGLWCAPEPLAARALLARGLVDEVAEEPDARAAAWRGAFEGARPAASALLLLERARGGLGASSALALERALFALSFAGDDARRGAAAFFGARRRGGKG